MVGEIRDVETAEIAIQASLTGHLVLSTIHTNDAATGITRLVDMGVAAVPGRLLAGRPAGPAPGAPGLLHCASPTVPPPPRSSEHRHRPADLLPGGQPLKVPLRDEHGKVIPIAHPRGRKLPPRATSTAPPAARSLPRQRLLRPHRHLRGADDHRGRSAASPSATPTPAQIKAAALAQGMRTLRDDGALKVLCRHHHPRRGHACDRGGG
jgi:general secretion pathway protein E